MQEKQPKVFPVLNSRKSFNKTDYNNEREACNFIEQILVSLY